MNTLYTERGEPVIVLARWARTGMTLGPPACPGFVDVSALGRRTGPRNVLIARGGGELVVRPFRGLRLPKGTS